MQDELLKLCVVVDGQTSLTTVVLVAAFCNMHSLTRSGEVITCTPDDGIDLVKGFYSARINAVFVWPSGAANRTPVIRMSQLSEQPIFNSSTAN